MTRPRVPQGALTFGVHLQGSGLAPSWCRRFLVIFLSTIITQAIPAFTTELCEAHLRAEAGDFNPPECSAPTSPGIDAANYDGSPLRPGAYCPGATDRTAPAPRQHPVVCAANRDAPPVVANP